MINSRACIAVLLITIIVACNNRPVQNLKSDSTSVPLELHTDENQITCWGVGEISLEDSFSGIEEKVGKTDISRDSLFLEGTFERLITTLWKGTDKEIVIHWEETKPPFNTIRYLEISDPESPYHFGNGIKIGTTLSEMVALNNTPITLYGFAWDYGGTFVDFNNGKLAGDIPCFGGVFQPLNTDIMQVKELLGDQKISSSHPAFKKHEAALKVIRILKSRTN